MALTTGTYREALYIEGQWRSADGTIEVTDLADGGTFATVAGADAADADAALAAAKAAQPTLRETSAVERADWMASIAAGIDERSDELAEVIVREAGKPIGSAESEVAAAAERFRRAAEEIRAVSGDFLEGTTAGHEGWQAIVKRQPVGTVLCIAPYNYPVATMAQQVAPALVAGNAVIVKPGTYTPVSGAILAEIVDAAVPDLPAGAFGFVPGRSSEIGDVLAGDGRIDAIAMTGSTRAGKRIAAVSGMVELHFELGGNAPAIVFGDADIDEAATAAATGGLSYAGQRCSAISRVLAIEAVHDELVDRIDAAMADWQAGDLFDRETSFGPLITEDHARWVRSLVDDAIDRGATLVRGGEVDGRLMEPTLLAAVPAGADILTEEQFGPVIAVASFADEDEAITMANDTALGLDAAVFTNEYDRAFRVADALDVGGVRINGRPSHGLGDIPFGGVDDSGIGREGIHYSIERFLDSKTIIL